MARTRTASIVAACALAVYALPGAAQDHGAEARERARSTHNAVLAKLMTTGDRAAARAEFLALVAADSSYAEPRYNLGVLAEADEQWVEALRWFEECARVAAPASRFKTRAAEAIARVNTKITKDGTPEGKRQRQYDEALARAKAMLDAGLMKEAFAAAAIVDRIDPARWEAHVVAASALQSQRDFAEAGRFLGIALERAPASVKPKVQVAIERNAAEGKARELAREGDVALAKKDYAAAGDKLAAAWQLTTMVGEYGIAAGLAYTYAGKNAEAKTVFEDVVKRASPADAERAKAALAALAAPERNLVEQLQDKVQGLLRCVLGSCP